MPVKPNPLPPPAPDLGAAILGIWRLTSREDYDAGGRRLIDPVLGAEPLGIVCFAPKQFAAQFMNRSRGLVEQSRDTLKSSRDSARDARRLIAQSRTLLSDSADRVVLSASRVTAARWSAR